jgi:hypothetical protein
MTTCRVSSAKSNHPGRYGVNIANFALGRSDVRDGVVNVDEPGDGARPERRGRRNPRARRSGSLIIRLL